MAVTVALIVVDSLLIADSDVISLRTIDAVGDLTSAVDWLLFSAYVICVICVVRWFHAAYRNLTALGAGTLRFGPGWAIGAWFVPVLNVWVPKQIANAIWRGSDPEPAPDPDARRERPVPVFLHAWWGLFLLAMVWGVPQELYDPDTFEGMLLEDVYGLVGLVVNVLAAFLAIALVRRVTLREERLASRLGSTTVDGVVGEAELSSA